MHLLDFVMIFLASGALVNAWMHAGGLFEEWRDSISVWAEREDAYQRRRQLLAQLLTCRVCLTYHASFWLLVLFFVPSLWLSPPWCVVWFIPVYALAATRLSLLIGSLTAALPIDNDPEND